VDTPEQLQAFLTHPRSRDLSGPPVS
jgi:hypothetical protein